MSVVEILSVCGLGVCLSLGIFLYGYWVGKQSGRRERCGRHSHAERVAADRFTAAQHNGPAARVTTADFRHTRIEEGDELWDDRPGRY